MKTIAQQLNLKAFPFMIEVDNRCVYYENSKGYWVKAEYQDGKRVYHENSCGYWEKREWQDGKCVYFKNSYSYWEKYEWQDGKRVYFENSKGYWDKQEWQGGRCVYFEDSYVHIRDNRPKSKAQAKVEQARKLLEEAERELKEQSCKQ